MSRRRYQAQPVRHPDGRRLGWSVFLARGDNTPRMAAAFTGSFAGWRAWRHASALNRKGWQ